MRKRRKSFVLDRRNGKCILRHGTALLEAADDKENLYENYGAIRGNPGAGKGI